jgi:hypothetical protein
MPVALAALVASLALAPPPCAYDRDRIMALDQQAFDQDLAGGWRVLAREPACYLAAADLIRDYREAHRLTDSILYWHEGQMRAEAAQNEAAIALFGRARHAEPDPFGWNLYVDASIAFLRGDRPALQRARDALAALPRPEDFQPRDVNGHPINLAWPPNLNVVDGFIRCFGQTYEQAYACAPPVAVERATR